MILINSKHRMGIHGLVSAKGTNASTPIDSGVGGGGGSGGAIYLQTSILEGNGEIKLDGGSGSSPGGGGGAGGAFFFLLKDFYNPGTYPENTINWKKGDPVILGGA